MTQTCMRTSYVDVHAYLGDPRGEVADGRDDVAPLLAPRQLRLVGEAQPHVTLVVLRWWAVLQGENLHLMLH